MTFFPSFARIFCTFCEFVPNFLQFFRDFIHILRIVRAPRHIFCNWTIFKYLITCIIFLSCFIYRTGKFWTPLIPRIRRGGPIKTDFQIVGDTDRRHVARSQPAPGLQTFPRLPSHRLDCPGRPQTWGKRSWPSSTSPQLQSQPSLVLRRGDGALIF